MLLLDGEYRHRGFRRVALEVLEGNAQAERFYERHGYARQRRSTFGKSLM
ncbi:MAG: GNAT family N-acetyltransferase [Patescibacteria group bacterium]